MTCNRGADIFLPVCDSLVLISCAGWRCCLLTAVICLHTASFAVLGSRFAPALISVLRSFAGRSSLGFLLRSLLALALALTLTLGLTLTLTPAPGLSAAILLALVIRLASGRSLFTLLRRPLFAAIRSSSPAATRLLIALVLCPRAVSIPVRLPWTSLLRLGALLR